MIGETLFCTERRRIPDFLESPTLRFGRMVMVSGYQISPRLLKKLNKRLHAVVISRLDPKEFHASTSKCPVQESIPLPSICPCVRRIIELDGKEDRSGLDVVENKIHVLLAEPTSVRPLPQLVRTLQHIRQARLNRD